MKLTRRLIDFLTPSRTLECAAAKWVLRSRDGLSAAEQSEFDRWLAANANHAEVYAEMRETLDLLGQLRDTSFAPLATPNLVRFQDSRYDSYNRTRRLLRFAPAGIAAAAAFAIAAVTWMPQSPEKSYAQSATTEVGDLRQLDLPDGSVVHLNTDSVLSVAYSAKEREVHLLRGEAFFTVARDRHRPFHVRTSSVSVHAIGTAFNVRCREAAVEVLVQEGKVSVDPTEPSPSPEIPQQTRIPARRSPTNHHVLSAGERALISTAENANGHIMPVVVSAVEKAQIASALAWQSRRLEFSDSPLSEVVAEFNRYNQHKLTIGDPALATVTFGGVFASNGYESLVEVLEQSFGVAAERKDNVTILRRAQ